MTEHFTFAEKYHGQPAEKLKGSKKTDVVCWFNKDLVIFLSLRKMEMPSSQLRAGLHDSYSSPGSTCFRNTNPKLGAYHGAKCYKPDQYTKAPEESEWLRVNLHKWLDDEYCPEATNVEISTVAAQSYYQSLVQKQTDLGEILLRMAGELESISYQESFHGAFSSANAAVSLIIQRIEQD
ncbi:hypothetical protein Acr_17g0002110 [Actinidia rufa]|uniref:Uncharacterized protein n=1 Tax=Actinidia rufa TaxID=165716 RepID=A0A7J0G1J0_9ERIC|nr:hypothetical protein Acr_17g0002110 [Actinidia rufa]